MPASLGAALSTLCSLDLSILHPHVHIEQYTFGEPRVGNKVGLNLEELKSDSDSILSCFIFLVSNDRRFVLQAFAKFFESSSVAARFRAVHYKDPVPHLPPLCFGESCVEAGISKTHRCFRLLPWPP